MQLTEGILFHNRYTLVRLIGRGGFSEVWLARDQKIDFDVALKVYAPNGRLDDNGIALFSKEMHCVCGMNHPNLLTPKHFDVCDGTPYLVLSYCAKGSVTKRTENMSESELRQLLCDVSAGLDYLHSHHIIHQDIKPDNILQAADGHFLISDFGISVRLRSTLQQTQGMQNGVSGTPPYMAPERFSTNLLATPASDIWALGATMFELIEGHVPFGDGTLPAGLLQKNGADIPEMKAQVSDFLKRTVRQMLTLDAKKRPMAKALASGEKVVIHGESNISEKLLDVLGDILYYFLYSIGLLLLTGSFFLTLFYSLTILDNFFLQWNLFGLDLANLLHPNNEIMGYIIGFIWCFAPLLLFGFGVDLLGRISDFRLDNDETCMAVLVLIGLFSYFSFLFRIFLF